MPRNQLTEEANIKKLRRNTFPRKSVGTKIRRESADKPTTLALDRAISKTP